MEKFLKFCFKGNRNYVHGTDMFNIAMQTIGITNVENMNFSIYNKTDKNILLSTTPKDKNLIFKLSFKDENNENKIFLGYETNIKPDCRYPFDEKKIINKSIIDRNYIELKDTTGFSFIENVVACNKYLLNQLVKEKVKWYFTRLILKEIPKNYKSIKLVYISSLQNFKLTKTDIYIDDNKKGEIYFSRI